MCTVMCNVTFDFIQRTKEMIFFISSQTVYLKLNEYHYDKILHCNLFNIAHIYITFEGSNSLRYQVLGGRSLFTWLTSVPSTSIVSNTHLRLALLKYLCTNN